jgi:hypothetical protein
MARRDGGRGTPTSGDDSGDSDAGTPSRLSDGGPPSAVMNSGEVFWRRSLAWTFAVVAAVLGIGSGGDGDGVEKGGGDKEE